MIYTDKIILSTKGFCDIIDITEEIERIVRNSKIREGIAMVFVVGSTASITTIEAEPNLVKDFQELMEKLVPQNKSYHHNQTWGDDNGFSHLRASLVGPSLSISVSDGKMTLGTWQQIVLCDFDNKGRKREVIIKIVGEKES